MTVQPNGTDAKDIVFHFLKLTDTRATSSIMGKHTNQVKQLLTAGYTKQEIIDVMNYVIIEKGIGVYSIGYFSSCINDALRELKEREAKAQLQERQQALQKEMHDAYAHQQSEVTNDEESKQRNREKATRFGVQSGKRAKFNFDMFEGE